VTDEQHPDTARDNKTEVIPPVTSGEGLPHTKELPVVVEDEPTVVTPPPARDESLATPSSPAPAGPSSGARRPVVLVALAAALVLVVVVGAVALRGRGSTTTAGAAGSTAAVKLPATITTVDPSGGSGFRRDGAAWRTQTYASADFGNLKDGVGLLLDLGGAKQVGRVTLNVDGGPIAVELRAGDSGSTSASGYQRVATDPSASGSTTFTVKGDAEHRYWLIWVTRLASAGGGYRAVLENPTVFGSRS
jgi:hypothetical protein